MVSSEEALSAHKKSRGKFEIVGKVPLSTMTDLSTYYTPGVAFVSEAIKHNKTLVYDYTTKSNTIAIVSDGTRILGLGDIGPEAGLPVMEGKAILFKKFGGVDAIPLCIDTKDEDEIVKFVTQIAPTFGAINIEDISSPKSFNVVKRLSESLDIPVFHDDQHGTGVVTLAALTNALKLAGKGKDSRIIINGAGSAGVGICRLLVHAGYRNIIVIDSKGALFSGRREEMNATKEEIAAATNPGKKSGGINELAVNADVLIGVSGKARFDKALISKMNQKPIIFALSNPVPEIEYEDAKRAGAFIVATGRSDTPNQVNNVVAFPGIMRGLLDVRAKQVTLGMLEKAATALAKCVKKPGPEMIIPKLDDYKVAAKTTSAIAAAVAKEAVKRGVARVTVDPKEVRKRALALLRRYSKIEKAEMRNPPS